MLQLVLSSPGKNGHVGNPGNEQKKTTSTTHWKLYNYIGVYRFGGAPIAYEPPKSRVTAPAPLGPLAAGGLACQVWL